MTQTQLTRVSQLKPDQKQYVMAKVSQEKQTSTAYILWFIFGVHYFYLGRPFMNILYWITLGGCGIWSLIDLFRMKSLVSSCNENMINQAITEASQL